MTTTAAKERAGKLIEGAARFGYASKGFIYVMLGALATIAAWGTGGKTTDTHGAMGEIGKQPFGSFLVWTVGMGLLCYSVWRLTEAVSDTEHCGATAMGLLRRSGYVISAVVYGFLGWEAVAHQGAKLSRSARRLYRSRSGTCEFGED